MAHQDFLSVQVLNNGYRRICLNQHGRDELGTVSFIDVPAAGVTLTKGSKFISVEAEKAVTDIESPVTGKIVLTNTDAIDDPSLLSSNDDKINWICEVE